MWKRIHKKLNSHSGETLAEVLIALLIIALSTMLLVSMISTASSIDIAARNRDKIFYKDLTHAETHTTEEGTEAEKGTINIISDEVELNKEIDVTFYGGNGLTSYEKAPSNESGGGGE